MEPKDYQLRRPLNRYNANGQYESIASQSISWWDKVSQSSSHGNFKSPTPYSYTTMLLQPHRNRKTQYSAKMYYDNGQNSANFSGPLYTSHAQSLFEPPSAATEAYNVALGNLVDKARGGLDISVDLAESHQATRMFRELGKAERWFAGVGVKRWANEWLQLQYGWLPLLGTVYGSAEELIRHNDFLATVKSLRKVARSYSGKRTWSSNPVDVTGVSNYSNGVIFSDYSAIAENICDIKIRLRPLDWVQAMGRWSSLNPASIAWELTPYSFVVDWFIDIGGFLRGLETSYLFNSAVSDGYLSETFTFSTGESCSWHVSSAGIPQYSQRICRVDTEASLEKTTMSRTPLYAFPGPRCPQINTDLSWRRWVSAGALIAQKILR